MQGKIALFYKINSSASAINGNSIVNMRCPACGRLGAFHGLESGVDQRWAEFPAGPIPRGGQQALHNYTIGYRVCPNPSCRNVVFFVQDKDLLVETFPPEVLDFDSSNLPPSIAASLEEAVKCHAAGCYRAAALMVRRVLEELCDDKKAAGSDLKKRLAALGGTITMPPELLAAADELRILGNDAAHIEARTYDKIGRDEVEVAVELAKELLKAVYQYGSLLEKLKKLKSP